MCEKCSELRDVEIMTYNVMEDARSKMREASRVFNFAQERWEKAWAAWREAYKAWKVVYEANHPEAREEDDMNDEDSGCKHYDREEINLVLDGKTPPVIRCKVCGTILDATATAEESKAAVRE
jgi:hypothetical protein